MLLPCVAAAQCSGRQQIQTARRSLTTDHWPGNLCVPLVQPAAALASLSSNSFYRLQNGSFCGFILQWILEEADITVPFSTKLPFYEWIQKNLKYNFQQISTEDSELGQLSWLNWFSQPVLG